MIPRAVLQLSDVLDVPAQALIYSTNVLLNCSGGVGSGLVQRYGLKVQEDLHRLRAEAGVRFAERGTIIAHVSEGMPYRMVYHTVPSDGFYQTTEEIVADILRRTLENCSHRGDIRVVALSALATGYGRMELADFLRIASGVISTHPLPQIEEVVLALADPYAFEVAKDQTTREGLCFQWQ